MIKFFLGLSLIAAALIWQFGWPGALFSFGFALAAFGAAEMQEKNRH